MPRTNRPLATRPGARPYALGGVYRDYFNPLTGLCPQVHRSAGLDRAKGGDYAELGTAARAVFRTIRQVGVRPTIVASGMAQALPCPNSLAI